MPSLAVLLVPLFGTIAIGALVRGLRLFDAEDARRFSRFVFMVAMPIAGFDFLRQSDPSTDVLLGLGGAYLIGLSVTVAAAFVISRSVLGLTIREAGAAVFTCTCGNAIFLGIPIALAVPEWTAPFFMLVIFEGTFVFAIGTALMTWPEGDGAAGRLAKSVLGAVGRAFLNPIIIGTLLGLAASIVDLPMPEPFAELFGFMARVVGPVGLFVLGLSIVDIIARGEIGDVRAPLALVPMKLIVFPAVTGALAWLFTGDPSATGAGILFTGLSPAVASIVLSNVYGQWQSGVTSLVGVGTLLGLITLVIFLIAGLPA
ncbi:MAG: AEC family transporter [Pseudomonadota bacterium]